MFSQTVASMSEFISAASVFNFVQTDSFMPETMKQLGDALLDQT